MNDFLGIVIDRSLKSEDFIYHLNVVATRQIGSWGLLLVSIPENELNAQIETLQHNMVEVEEDCWYAHFFRGNDLIVVYKDRAFRATLDPETWNEAIQYGLDNGIPIEQLDFKPRTRTDAASYFGLVDN
jgi:(2Fe-2S) ferredoxin